MGLDAPAIRCQIEGMASALGVGTERLIAVAGTVLALHGIRPAHDIDISVDDEILPLICERFPGELRHGACNSILYATGIWEIGSGWGNWPHAGIQDKTTVIGGVRHIDLAYVAYWKSRQEREKDKDDMWLIARYISRITSTGSTQQREYVEPTLRLLRDGTPELSPPINVPL